MRLSTIMAILCVLNGVVAIPLYGWRNDYTPLWIVAAYLCQEKQDANSISN